VDTEVKNKDCQSENPSNKPEKEQTAVKSVDTEVKNKDCIFDFSVHRFDSGLLFSRFITWVFRLTVFRLELWVSTDEIYTLKK
jgi:hypothetical protein